MKTILKLFTAALALLFSHTELALGCRAEYGDQLTVAGLTAAASLNNHQYTVVRLSAATAVNICSFTGVSSATHAPFGVLQNKPYVNEAAQVAILGMSKVKAGGTLIAGAYITHDSSGHVVVAGSGDMVLGRALQATTAVGEIVPAIIFPPIRWAT